jgi:hypothetical protein
MDKDYMEYTHIMKYSAIKKNKIMPFAGKHVELKSIMLREISQDQKVKYQTFLFVEPRPKMMMMILLLLIIMGHECLWVTVLWGGLNGEGKERILKSEEDGSTLQYIHKKTA